jgi:hypothetical protein
MTHTTVLGKAVEFPHEVSGKPSIKWTEIDKHYLSKYTRLFDILLEIEYQFIALREDNKRLKCENEFMIKLINEREI